MDTKLHYFSRVYTHLRSFWYTFFAVFSNDSTMIIPAIDRTQNSDLPETLEAAHQVILQLRQEIETLKELVRERLASAYGRQLLIGRCIPICY